MTADLERLRRALEVMPDADRRVFELARFEGLDYRAIAERLSLTMTEVEARMAAAMRHLADYDQAR